MNMKLLLLSTVVAFVIAGQTVDRDVIHGHSDSYFEGLKSDGKNKTLNIHVISHTHDDVGWLKTADQYYSGDADYSQRAGVMYTINGVYDQLMKDPKKKFTYVEMAFFQKWWDEQTEEVHKNVKVLVDEGRLQFANAGWSMSDEACVHYEDFINNLKAGHDFLKEALDYKPTIGWHIDPFGHHSATAALFAEMGFNAWFFARMDRDDKAKRIEESELEWLWRPFNESLGPRAEIFTHMMYNHYSAPPGFCFSEFCTDSPIVDNKKLRTYNIEERAEELHDYLVHMSEHYKTGDLLVPFGDDFNYMNAQKMFYNIDKLIDYMNEHYEDINMFYSTPYEYVDAVHEADIEWPTKYDDLFPYSDGPDAYWTGYYTSRANFKSFVRYSSSDMNSHGYYLALDNLINNEEVFDPFQRLFEEMGVMQHHDAVSGTERQHVADDYADTLTVALDNEKEQFLESFKRVSHTELENLSLCYSHNSTYHECPTKALEDPKVAEVSFHVVNPSNRRATIAKVPIPHSNITLHKLDGSPMDSDIICAPLPSSANINSTDGCYMYFPVDMSANSEELFKLFQSDSEHHIKPTRNSGKLQNSFYSAEIAEMTDEGALLHIQRDGQVEAEGVLLQYQFYTSYDDREHQRSGAYIFRPNISDESPATFNHAYTYDGFSGKFVNQLRLFGDQVDITITGNINTDFVEIGSEVKGIPLTDDGHEVVLHLTFDKINNDGIFYTDSMGMEMQQRKVNYRPTWDLNVTQEIAGNYYPVNHGVIIKDQNMTLEVLNDRSQGATSLHDGEIEFMIQRRMYRDDGRGVGEALNETNPDSPEGRGIETHIKHYLRFYNNTQDHGVVQTSRWMQREIDMPLIYVFGSEGNTTSLNQKNLLKEALTLPDEVKMIMHPQKDGTIFLRLENIMDCVMDTFFHTFNNDFSDTTSQVDISCDTAVTVNVDELARHFANLTSKTVKSVTEVSNTGLFTMSEMKDIRKKWKGADFTTPEPDYSSNTTQIDITPQRIRSFVLEFTDSQSIKEFLATY